MSVIQFATDCMWKELALAPKGIDKSQKYFSLQAKHRRGQSRGSDAKFLYALDTSILDRYTPGPLSLSSDASMSTVGRL